MSFKLMFSKLMSFYLYLYLYKILFMFLFIYLLNLCLRRSSEQVLICCLLKFS